MPCWRHGTKQAVTMVCHWKRVVTMVCHWTIRRRRLMSKDGTMALRACLRELHLPAVAAQYEAVGPQARAGSWSYADYLAGLLPRACQRRGHRRVERLGKISELPRRRSRRA